MLSHSCVGEKGSIMYWIASALLSGKSQSLKRKKLGMMYFHCCMNN